MRRKRLFCVARVSNPPLFEKPFWDKAAKKSPYSIAVGTEDKHVFAYCLCRTVDGIVEVLIMEAMRDEKKFNQVVETLARCFDAPILRS